MSDLLPAWAASHPIERRAEPLAESAPLAARWAETHCRVDPATGESCRGYHTKWQRRRLEGRDLGPGNDAPLLASLVRGLSQQGALRSVLICGSADYALLALVADAVGTRPFPSVTVLDLCETPLLVNRWFAARHGLAIDTIQGEALAFRPARPYDLIVVHTLLGFFDDAGRRDLVARWRDMLTPGGRVLLSHPLQGAVRPGRADAPKRPVDEALVEDFRTDAAKLQFKLASPGELAPLFAGAGFKIEAALAARRPPKIGGGVRGLWRRMTSGGATPPAAGGRDYAVLLARRPTR